MGQDGVAARVEADGVDGEDSRIALGRDVDDVAGGGADAGVVAEDVEVAVFANNLVDYAADGGVLGYVEGGEDDVSASFGRCGRRAAADPG